MFGYAPTTEMLYTILLASKVLNGGGILVFRQKVTSKFMQNYESGPFIGPGP